jgi:MFS family permease
MMALFTWPLWVFSARTMDRLGKGIRTGARDAMLSDEATLATKGTVFGFHRAMDTLGAAIGPVLALIFLHFYPGSYRVLFFIALIPGLLAVISSFVVREKRMSVPGHTKKIHFLSFLKYISESSRNYRLLLSGLLLFAMFNSSDMFLLLMLKQNGFNDTAMIGAYIFYNLVYVLFAYPLGILADKYGLKKIFILGLVLFAITYFGMAVTHHPLLFYGLFFLYGIYAASTEGIAKAWISNIASRNDTATAIGTYEGLRSISALLASSLAGFIWFYIRPEAIFFMTGSVVVLIILFFISIPVSTHPEN